MTVKSSARVGYLNPILTQGGGNLNESIFKSSNAWGMHCAGEGRGGEVGEGGGSVDVLN